LHASKIPPPSKSWPETSLPAEINLLLTIAPAMVGRIHIVRHGHGLHNVDNDSSIPDPELTTEGMVQSGALRRDFPHNDKIGLIITSPLRRSIQTTLLAFADVIDERHYRTVEGGGGGGVPGGVDLVLDPYLQETGGEPCNTGSDRARLKTQWPKLDYSKLLSPWPLKEGDFSSDEAAVTSRAKKVRHDFKKKIDTLSGNSTRKDIVVVTHSGFARELTENEHLVLNFTQWKSYTIETDPHGEPKLVEDPTD
jgi:broad specificity phosphatase PhoE